MDKTYEPLAAQTLGSAAASVTFSSIPQTYTDLKLICFAQLSALTWIHLRFNSDSGSNYSVNRIYGNGTTAYADRFNSQTGIDVGYLNSTNFGYSEINIMNYANSSTFKTISNRWGSEGNSGYVLAGVGLWRNTASITTISLTPYSGGVNLNTGSSFTLYGIRAA